MLSKLALGVSLLNFDTSKLGESAVSSLKDIGEGLAERTTPRYAVALPLVNVQISGVELEGIIRHYISIN
jgi:hypothetical protein